MPRTVWLFRRHHTRRKFLGNVSRTDLELWRCGCAYADFTKSYWRHHRLPRPMRSNSDRRIRKLFSNSLWQTITSPAPQPQSKRIAQKGIGLAAWMAIARLSTPMVKGTSIPISSKAEPRTAQTLIDKDASQNPPGYESNHVVVEQAQNEVGPVVHGFAPRMAPLLRSPVSTGNPFAAHSVIPPA